MKFSKTALFDGLMSLMNVKDNPFFFKDTKINDQLSYRIFCYTIPGFENYQLPFAKESRGSMFLVNHHTGEMIDLIALPMPKFFTFGEQQDNVNIKDAKRAFLKLDGSLISTYIDTLGKLKFKTKRSPEQTTFTNLINEVLTEALKIELTVISKNHTVDIELTSKSNRVILDYDKTEIHVLNIRNKNTGEFIEIYDDAFKCKYPAITSILAPVFDISEIENLTTKKRNIDLKFIEGCVVEMNDGTRYKVKTNYYLSQNKFSNIQDFKKYDELLVLACIEETFDELRTLFHYKKRSENYDLDGILKNMDYVEKKVIETYNPFVKTLNDFLDTNKDLKQEDFLKAVKDNNLQSHFNVLMPMYKGLDYDLKSHYMKIIGKKIKTPKS